jgi:hypothetical protein
MGERDGTGIGVVEYWSDGIWSLEFRFSILQYSIAALPPIPDFPFRLFPI